MISFLGAPYKPANNPKKVIVPSPPPALIEKQPQSDSLPFSSQAFRAPLIMAAPNLQTPNPFVESIQQLSPASKSFIKSMVESGHFAALSSVQNTVHTLPIEKQNDLYETAATLNISDPETLTLMAKAETHFSSEEFLKNSAQIKDQWLLKTLQNPRLQEADKIRVMKTASKPLEFVDVIKSGNLFFNATPQGNIIDDSADKDKPNLGESKTLGLFTNDTQFLSNYALDVSQEGKAVPLSLKSVRNDGNRTRRELSDGENVTLTRDQVINQGTFFEALTVKNTSDKELTLSLNVDSKPEDIFASRFYKFDSDVWQDKKTVVPQSDTAIFKASSEEGRDFGLKFKVNTSTLPYSLQANENNSTTLTISIPAGQSEALELSLVPQLNDVPFIDGKNIAENKLPKTFAEAIQTQAKLDPSFPDIAIKGKYAKVVNKALQDVSMLINTIHDDGQDYKVITAGLPRYACLFGRDSIITAKEMLDINPSIVKDTINILAKYQGKPFEERFKAELADPNTDVEALKSIYTAKEEAEGKILHEFRVGELAHKNKIPHNPYYGTVDATPLWVSLVGDYYNRTGDISTVKNLETNLDKALEWIDHNSKDGYLYFEGSTGQVSIKNQGWKDSGDSARHLLLHPEDPTATVQDPPYPLALAEVQGNVYEAKTKASQLFKALADDYQQEGQAEKAKALEEKALMLKQEAETLKSNFNKDFWMEEKGFVATALDANGQQIPSISSNGGQTLPSGILSADHAQTVEHRLMEEDMNSGWGLRTLSSKEPAYNEISYHNGSVWPHDTAIMASGMSPKNATELAGDLLEAANTFPDGRIQELYSGHAKQEGDTEIQPYAESCAPQAWSAGSLVKMLVKSLGLKVDGVHQQVTFDNPQLPRGIDAIKLSKVQVGESSYDIVAQKTAAGEAQTTIIPLNQ